jgi:hypothetical protein
MESIINKKMLTTKDTESMEEKIGKLLEFFPLWFNALVWFVTKLINRFNAVISANQHHICATISE